MSQYREDSAGCGQNVTLLDRRVINISGVEDVISFDENSVVMQTCLGVLTVDGEELHIVRLNTDGKESPSGDGGMIIEGKIAGVFYVDDTSPAKGNGWFRRKAK